jgi:predicted nuclease of predicted toxin-antitoxin system
MKKSELKSMIREEMQNLNESYESKELHKVAKNHD